VCYYKISADNRTFSTADYNYTLSIELTGLTNVQATLTNGTSFWDAKNSTTNKTDFSMMFSPHKGQVIYLVVKGTMYEKYSKERPTLSAKFQLISTSLRPVVRPKI
jgi:hypothetical protein